MKRKMAFIVCLLAVLSWTMHSFVPHHHVGVGEPAFMEKICWDYHFTKGDCHDDGDAHHQHENHLCLFLQMPPLTPEETQLQEQEPFHLDQSYFLAILAQISWQAVDSIRFYYIIFNAPPDFQTFVASGLGLRAPPTV
ncbi:MAG TPA: hypothetical protein PLB75_03420 [Paludibacteraceae bacterium]|nr:hypothetical protein [Paludibacteraceae bacterium]HQC04516.1 hypothetical protein [Paludibacteraceae bacterium]